MSQTLPHDHIVPFKTSTEGKKKQVANMFNAIAKRYDFINRFLSARIDMRWRKKTIVELKTLHPQYILDVATGTADMALLAHKILYPKKIIGIDISEGMLDIGRKKISKKDLTENIMLQIADSEALPFKDNEFDAIMVAFGVRNFENLEKGLKEMLRVLKSDGKVAILECTEPKSHIFRWFYKFYMKLVPNIGGLVSKNKAAYQYLNNSIQAFPERETFLQILQAIGFKTVYRKLLSFGVCTIYVGIK